MLAQGKVAEALKKAEAAALAKQRREDKEDEEPAKAKSSGSDTDGDGFLARALVFGDIQEDSVDVIGINYSEKLVGIVHAEADHKALAIRMPRHPCDEFVADLAQVEAARQATEDIVPIKPYKPMQITSSVIDYLSFVGDHQPAAIKENRLRPTVEILSGNGGGFVAYDDSSFC